MAARSLKEAITLFIEYECLHPDDPTPGHGPNMLVKDLPVDSLVAWIRSEEITWTTATGDINV